MITLSGRSIGRHKYNLALVTAAAETIGGPLREQELIEEKLRLSSMLSLIFDSIADGFIKADTNLKITNINKTASNIPLMHPEKHNMNYKMR